MGISKTTEQLRQIKEELLAATDAPLYKYRNENNYFPVIGEGSHTARIVFVGEAPGKNEALTGRPFCGASGKVLDELLRSINLSRDEVYITNIVKDRPVGNRDPRPEEIAYYGPFLERQLRILQPKVIAPLGRFSMDYILSLYSMPERGKSISELHGKVLRAGETVIVPLYHPAASIYNRSLRETLIRDMQQLTIFL